MIDFDSNRKPKAKVQDRKLPVINLQRRVIDFGDDQELFKIVAKLIMKRVDLDPDDLDSVLGQSGQSAADIDSIDLDALTGGHGDAQAAPDAEPVPEDRRRLPLSERFRLRIRNGEL